MFSDPTLAFIGLAALGLLIFVVFMIFDDIEVGGIPVGQAIGVLLAAGAGSGLIVYNYLGLTLAILVGGVVGVIAVVGVVYMVSALKKADHSGRQVDFEPLVGQEVQVVWWERTSGEVLVDLSGQRVKVAAESRRSIKKDTALKIQDISVENDTLLKVLVEPLS